MTPKISSRLSAEARQEDSTNPKAAARLAAFLAATDHVLTLRWPADRVVRLGAQLLADAPAKIPFFAAKMISFLGENKQFLALLSQILEGSFSAVSNPIFANTSAFGDG